jgi:hypothetical protein
MRIYERFTVVQLVETVMDRHPSVTYDNAQKFVRRLVEYGHVVKIGNYRGGRPGRFQEYRFVSREIAMPVLGIGRTEKFLKKEKEKEKETDGDTERGGETHPLPIPLPEGEGIQYAVPADTNAHGGEV